jgi:hypothetical protein
VGRGNFSSGGSFTGGSAPAIGDLNGDGVGDLVVAGSGVTVIAGGRTGLNAAQATTYDVGVAAAAVAIADLDGDGRPDLALAVPGTNAVQLLRFRSASR